MVTGGCLCGAVRFESESAALFCVHCHCEWCRRAHGAAFVTWLGLRAEAFTFRRGGEDALHWYASSEKSDRGFCTRCGTTLFFRSQLAPGEIHVALACVDDPSPFPPKAHVFYEAHAPWFTPGDDLPKIDRDAKTLAKYQALPRKPPAATS